jgi:hypothetical protein
MMVAPPTAPSAGWRSTVAEAGLNPIWLAQSKLRRRRFDECIEICSDVMQANPYDQVRILLPSSRRSSD